MFEQFTLDGQPTVGVNYKFLVVVYFCDNLEVEIREIVWLCGCDGLHLPFVGFSLWNWDESLHFIPFPLN